MSTPNRAQRRQAARALGNRGTKAKRRRQPPEMPSDLAFATHVDDTAARDRARRAGLLVPPNPTERAALMMQHQQGRR